MTAQMAERARTLGTFQQKGDLSTRGALGQKTAADWSKVCDAAIDIKPLMIRERLRAGAMQSTVTHTVATRYNPALLPLTKAATMRIKVGTDRVFNIMGGYDLDERHEWFVFECTEGTVDGQ